MSKQKTLKGSFSLCGKGLHTGLSLTVTFNPAPENLCILLLDAHALNLLYIHGCRAVEDRELRTVYLDETVVDAEGIES